MKLITLTANRVVNGKKEKVAEQANFPIAETIDDILEFENLDNGWNADEIVAAFNYGSRVKRQSQLKGETDPTAPSTIFKRLPKEKQEEILKQFGLLD